VNRFCTDRNARRDEREPREEPPPQPPSSFSTALAQSLTTSDSSTRSSPPQAGRRSSSASSRRERIHDRLRQGTARERPRPRARSVPSARLFRILNKAESNYSLALLSRQFQVKPTDREWVSAGKLMNGSSISRPTVFTRVRPSIRRRRRPGCSALTITRRRSTREALISSPSKKYRAERFATTTCPTLPDPTRPEEALTDV
jgi:hypothetical protein